MSLLRVTTDLEFLSIEYVDDTLTFAFFALNISGNMADQRLPAYLNATWRPRSRRIILSGNRAPLDNSLDILMAPTVDRSWPWLLLMMMKKKYLILLPTGILTTVNVPLPVLKRQRL